jgi:hypothetical protein
VETVISYAKSAAKYQKKIIFNAGVESSIRYIEPSSNYVPKVTLLFSPFGLPFVPLEIIGSNLKDIISGMEWTKDRTNPGGMLTMTITPDDTVINEIIQIIKKLPGGNKFSKLWSALGFSLEDLFKPMALCQLWIDGYHVMTGTVRSCLCPTGVSDDGKSKSYILTIDELGNLYTRNTIRMDTMILNGSEKHMLDSMRKAVEESGNIKGVPVREGIKSLINAFKVSTFLEQNISMSDGFPLFYRLLSESNPIGGIALKSYISNMFINSNLLELNNQSFWDYLKNFMPNPWMEFFTESGGRTIVTDAAVPPAVMFPGFNYVVARSVPYSNPLLGMVNAAHLPATALLDLNAVNMLLGGDFVVVTDADIEGKSLGFDGSGQATSFRTVYSEGSSTMPADICDKPIQCSGPLNPLASGGVSTFGISEMIESINCTGLYDLGIAADTILSRIAKTKISSLGIMSKPALSNLLAVWFRNQSRFREGTITTRMMPWARPGMYLLYLPEYSGNKKPENIRDIGIYYIDSLTHNYDLQDEDVTATTTMNVIRGCPLPTTVAQSALLLFDFEVLPPVSGLWDGEYKALQTARAAGVGG